MLTCADGSVRSRMCDEMYVDALTPPARLRLSHHFLATQHRPPHASSSPPPPPPPPSAVCLAERLSDEMMGFAAAEVRFSIYLLCWYKYS